MPERFQEQTEGQTENYQFKKEEQEISRRDFLKAAGIVGALATGNLTEACRLLGETVSKEGEVGRKISVEIFFAPHGTLEDWKKLPQKIKTADVFVPEMDGWNKSDRDEFNAVSEGKITPEQLLKKYGLSYATPEAEKETQLQFLSDSLYKSGVHIEFFDLPEGDPLANETDSVRNKIFEIPVLGFDFESILQQERLYLKKDAELVVKREQHILEKFQEFAERFRQGKIPGLENKKEIKVLFSIGAAHTSLFHKMRTKEYVSETFSGLPLVFSHSTEVMRRFIFNREVNDELIAKTIMQGLVAVVIKPIIDRVTADTNLALIFIRRVVERFSFDEIKNIFKKLRGGRLEENIKNAKNEVVASLNAKGIIKPTTEEDIKKFIKEKKEESR